MKTIINGKEGLSDKGLKLRDDFIDYLIKNGIEEKNYQPKKQKQRQQKE